MGSAITVSRSLSYPRVCFIEIADESSPVFTFADGSLVSLEKFSDLD